MAIGQAAFQRVKIVEEVIAGGMVTSRDAADIDDGQLSDALNVRVRYDQTFRRPGSNQIAGSGLVVSPVQDIFQYKKDDGSRFTINVHASGAVKFENGGVWTNAAGITGGSVTDHYQAATVKDRFVLAVNGQGRLKELITGSSTLQNLSANAPTGRFVTGAFNRVVTANIPGTGSTWMAWSADGVIDQFDPAVNETAGSAPISDSPSDMGDAIMGVLSISNRLFIPREQSLWIATKQPIATAPFYFASAVSEIGTNAPFSVARVFGGGVVFADSRTGTVWFYGMGGQPEAIGRLVEKTIFRNLTDPNKIVGSYDPSNYEYSLMVPMTTPDYVRIWTYNFITKAWVYDEIQNVTTIADYPYAFSSATFEDLIGTFDSQLGTLSTWGSSSVITNSSRLFGKKNGTMCQEDLSAVLDDAAVYLNRMASKELKLPHDDAYICEIRFEYLAQTVGQIALSYSKDGGNTWILAKTFTTTAGKALIAKYQRNVKCRRFRWKVESSNGQYGLLNYEIYGYPSGDSTK